MLQELITTEDKSLIQKYKDTLIKYKDLELTNKEVEKHPIYLEYAMKHEGMFTANDQYVFKANIDDETNIDTYMIKCPQCNKECNDKTWMENHMKHCHKVNFKKKVGFELTYTVQLREDMFNTMSTFINVRECFKCEHCTFISNNIHSIKQHINTKHASTKTEILKGLIGNRIEILTIMHKASEERRIQEEQRQYEEEKQKEAIIEAEMKHLQEIATLAEEEQRRRQEIIDTPLETKTTDIVSILQDIIGSTDVALVQEKINYLERYNDTKLTEEYEDVPIVLAMINTIGMHKKNYACTFADIFELDKTHIQFMEKDTKERYYVKPLIKCPFCTSKCNNYMWICNHIKREHKPNMLSKLGYCWTYLISSEERTYERISSYFCPTESYVCTMCGFAHTEKSMVIKHIQATHEQGSTILRGILGLEADIKQCYEKMYVVKPFNPIKVEQKDPLIYNIMHRLKDVETQTDHPTHVNAETNTGQEGGGARTRVSRSNTNSSNTETRSKGNSIEAQHLIQTLGFNFLHIDKDLKSQLIGCDNPRNACYMNSFIQAINNVQPFRDYILQNTNQNDNHLIKALQDIFMAMKIKQNIDGAWYIKPHETEIYTLLNCTPLSQNDPAEMLTRTLSKLGQNATALFEFIEYGDVRQEGSDAMNHTESYENILDISVENQARTDQGYTYKVDDLLNRAIDITETMRTTKIDINSEILCLHPIRTAYDHVSKLFYMLRINKVLKIGGNTYNLKATIVHRGSTIGSGHYVTYIRRDDETFQINDVEAHKIKENNEEEYVTYDGFDDRTDRASLLFYVKEEFNTEEDSTHITDQKEAEIQKWNKTCGLLPKINLLNNNINNMLSEVNTIDEYSNGLKEIISSNKEIWGSFPEMSYCEEFEDINILTYGIMKGILPVNKDEKICGFPGCKVLSKNGSGRSSHWKSNHDPKQYYNSNPFAEIFEIIGIDVSTITRCKNTTNYITLPLIKCPVNNCPFVQHQHINITEHIKKAHKDIDQKALCKLSGLHKHLWLMKSTGKNMTTKEILYTGEVYQCKECGWCSSNLKSAATHPGMIHREMKTEDKEFFEDANIGYIFYERDGTSISPFIGLKDDSDKNLLIYKEVIDDETNIKKKEDIIEISNRRLHEEGTTNQEETNSVQEIINEVNTDNTRITTNIISTNNNVPRRPPETVSDINPSISQNQEGLQPSNAMTPQEVRNGLTWHEQYYDMEERVPKYKSSNKKKITDAMKCVINDEITPLLDIALNKEIPDDVQQKEIINGYMCYCFHLLAERTQQALGILKKQTNNIKSNNQTKNILEDEIKSKKAVRDAGNKIVKAIENIEAERQADSSDGVVQNRETTQFDIILEEAQHLPEEMKINIFNTSNVDQEAVVTTINDIINSGHQTNIYDYIANADNDVSILEEKQLNIHKKKVRELFKISPRKAMKYYIDPHSSPNCPIPMDQIREELAERWRSEPFDAREEEQLWLSPFKLKDEDKNTILKMMSEEETFKNVIQSRDWVSAHGPDGIGYWALRVIPELGSKMMTLLSKIIMKYKFIPTTWHESRTILLFKKGDPNDLKNWRPLTITSCLYRTWTCAISNCLQCIHSQDTRILDQNQKGFTRGINGCTEHSNMITEIIADANRNRKDIYLVSLDLRDAFGSIPHDYLKYMLYQMNIPEEIGRPIFDSYDNAFTKVRIGGNESERVNINKGVKQGCPLSPLIFNFCMNPLLNYVEKEGEGYMIKDTVKVVIQAYADDIMVFSNSREGMEKNLEIIQSFLSYSRVNVNPNKCHSMTYVYRNERRYFEKEPFTIAGEPIPTSTLDDTIEYLGTDTTTTHLIRKRGAKTAINEMMNLIEKIGESVLTLNQKIYAIKTFAIPKVDFVLANGRVKLKEMKKMDQHIRAILDKHVRGASLPVELFYMHWKDGGFSMQQLHVRALATRAKTFLALYNSRSDKMREAMRLFVESERNHKKIGIIDQNEEPTFLNWKIPNQFEKGTDTITVHALRSSIKLGFTITINEETGNIVANFTKRQAHQPQQNHLDIPDEMIGENNNIVEQIMNAKDIVRRIMQDTRDKHRSKMIKNQYSGHSFIDLKNCPFANKFIGDYKNDLNDNISSWIVKARCNMLYTGAKASKMGIPIEQRPKCPYCGTKGDDTIAHRLNNCKKNLNEQTKRHNNVQNIVLSYMKSTLGNGYKYKTNSTIAIDDKHLPERFNAMKPDITAWDKNKLLIVEFSIPYANDFGRNGNTLDFTYNTKVNKYKDLAKEAKNTFKREVTLCTIIVSSLGAIHEESIKEIRDLLHITQKRKLEIILRRISMAACIGSYFIYNKLKFKEFKQKQINKNSNSINSEDEENENDAQEQVTNDVRILDHTNATTHISTSSQQFNFISESDEPINVESEEEEEIDEENERAIFNHKNQEVQKGKDEQSCEGKINEENQKNRANEETGTFQHEYPEDVENNGAVKRRDECTEDSREDSTEERREDCIEERLVSVAEERREEKNDQRSEDGTHIETNEENSINRPETGRSEFSSRLQIGGSGRSSSPKNN